MYFHIKKVITKVAASEISIELIIVFTSIYI